MKQLVEMQTYFKSFQGEACFMFGQMIIAHFIEITLLLHRVIIFRSARNPILWFSTSWTIFNSVFVLFLMFLVIHFHDRVRASAQLLSDSLTTRPFSPFEHISLSFVLDKIRAVSSQTMTVCNIVKVNRKLVLTIYSSFLTIAVLLVQIDNGALEIKEDSRNSSNPA